MAGEGVLAGFTVVVVCDDPSVGPAVVFIVGAIVFAVVARVAAIQVVAEFGDFGLLFLHLLGECGDQVG